MTSPIKQVITSRSVEDISPAFREEVIYVTLASGKMYLSKYTMSPTIAKAFMMQIGYNLLNFMKKFNSEIYSLPNDENNEPTYHMTVFYSKKEQLDAWFSAIFTEEWMRNNLETDDMAIAILIHERTKDEADKVYLKMKWKI